MKHVFACIFQFANSIELLKGWCGVNTASEIIRTQNI